MFESGINIGLDPVYFQSTSLQSKEEIINNIIYELTPYIDSDLKYRIQTVLTKHFRELTIERVNYTKESSVYNKDIVEQFCKIKKLEGCTDKTIHFYKKNRSMREMNYRDCKYNTSGIPTFVGYCDLPKYKTESGQRLVECCQEICADFEPKGDSDD